MYENTEQVEELAAVVDELARMFPALDRTEVEKVVTATYRRLAGCARVKEHLIELTVNEARDILTDLQRAAMIERRRLGRSSANA